MKRHGLAMALIAAGLGVGAAPVWAETCVWQNLVFPCDTGTCNAGANSFRCDWNCNSSNQCPQFASQAECDGGPDQSGTKFWAEDGRCTICGTGADNTITGTPGNDVLCGRSGHDVLSGGGGGDDVMNGESGNDTVNGGPGHDELYGGGGNDCVFGGATGSDTLSGDDGDDGVFGGYCGTSGCGTPISAPLLSSRMCGGKGADYVWANGPAHQCFDGGADQVVDPPTGCGIVPAFFEPYDCLYIADPEGDSGSHHVATMRNCVNLVSFSTLLPAKPACGCY